MAKKNVENILNELASKVLVEVGSREGKDPRKVINMRPHIYTLSYTTLLKEVTDQVSGKFSTKSSTRVEINPYRQNIIKEACKKYFKEVRAKMIKGKPGFDTEILEDNRGIFSIRITSTKQNASVFVTFIDSIRYRPLNELKDTLYRDLLLDEDDSISRRIIGYEKDGKRVGGLLDIGHVEGYSIAEKRIQLLFEKLEAKLKQAKRSSSASEVPLAKLIAEVKSNPRATNLKSIKFSSDIFVREQGVDSNRRIQAKQENALIFSMKKQITNLLNEEDWINLKTSPSAVDMVKESILLSVIKAGAKVNSRPSRSKDEKYKVSNTLKATKISTRHEDTGVKLTPKVKRSDKKRPQTKNWMQLLPIINAQLTQSVINNMGYPRLENRTGRFARSARVLKVDTTEKGFPTFVFDYERDPYDVFDRTSGRTPWNTPERDPKTLIDKSIRDIVKEMAIGRFFTRRMR